LSPAGFNSGSTRFVIDLAPGGRWFFALALVVGVVAVNVLNLYGAFMSVTTAATAIRPFAVSRSARTGITAVVCVVATGLAIAGRTSFINSYTDFILFLTYFLVPWTAINLVDFYLVRRERYEIAAIFDAHGIYGSVNWRGLGPYLLGVAVEVPFMNTSFYTGPVASQLGGADISWILGLIVASIAYYLASRPVRLAVSRGG
jgi:NCS1 family nucleobase:cation symporter-1